MAVHTSAHPAISGPADERHAFLKKTAVWTFIGLIAAGAIGGVSTFAIAPTILQSGRWSGTIVILITFALAHFVARKMVYSGAKIPGFILAVVSEGIALGILLLTALWSPLLGVQIPLFARLQQRGDPRQLHDAYRLLSKFLAAIMLPAATGLFLLMPNLVMLLGRQYADAIPAARILTLGLCLDAAISVPLAILMAYEQYRPMLIARSCALLAIPLVIFVVPRAELIGAALVMTGTRILCDGLAMALALRHFRLHYPTRFALRVFGASLAMAAVVAPLVLLVLTPPFPADPKIAVDKLLWLGYLIGNAASGGLGALVFLGVFKLTGGLDPNDRQRIRELRLPLANRLLRFL